VLIGIGLECARAVFAEVMMAVFDENWQKTRASITERGIFMFNNDLLSDVSLIALSGDEDDPKKSKMAIPAHKMVLSICSPVFFAMFCGKMAEKLDSLDLPDCEYVGVLEMLRYMYSEKTELNQNNVMQVLYVAKKFQVNSLVDGCIKFLQENLNTRNVFSVLSHAQQYDERILVDHCWEVIDREAEKALKSEEFTAIERSLLEEVVSRDSLTIREVELFHAVNLWATKECQRQGLSPDGITKRKILGESIVKGIRFPVMTEKEFAVDVLGCEILTTGEAIEIWKYFNSLTSSSVGFTEKERTGTIPSCRRFTGSRLGDCWWYNSEDCIDFQVDREIKLHGIRMFGSEIDDYVVILRIIDTRFHTVLATKSGKFSSTRVQFQSSFYYGYDVFFDSPVKLEKDVKFRVLAAIDGPDSMYGVDGSPSVQCHGVTFSFSESDDQDNNCTHVHPLCTDSDERMGQFPEFFFKVD